MAARNPACAQLGDFHQHRSDLSEAKPVGDLLHLSRHEEAKAGDVPVQVHGRVRCGCLVVYPGRLPLHLPPPLGVRHVVPVQLPEQQGQVSR